MITGLLIGVLVWMVSAECRLWINIHRLDEHLEKLHQKNGRASLFQDSPSCEAWELGPASFNRVAARTRRARTLWKTANDRLAAGLSGPYIAYGADGIGSHKTRSVGAWASAG